MPIMTYEPRPMSPSFTTAAFNKSFKEVELPINIAHIQATARFAHEARERQAQLLHECAEALHKPTTLNAIVSGGVSTLHGEYATRGARKSRTTPEYATAFAPVQGPGCSVTFSRTFDKGSDFAIVRAVHEGTSLQAAGVASQCSASDISTGEMAAMVLLGETVDSAYDYPATNAVRTTDVLEAVTQTASLENWIQPENTATTYDIGAVATIELPESARAYLKPTADGAFGGLVSAIGDASFEIFAALSNGKELYHSRTSRFLNATASALGTSGDLEFTTPVILGAELEVPAGATLIVTRTTITLCALRTLTDEGKSPKGGMVSAVIADRDLDPSNGVATQEHSGRAKVLMSSVVFRG